MFKRDSDKDLSRSPIDWSFGADSGHAAPAFSTLRQLMQHDLPEAEGLAETALIELLNAIEFELVQHHIRIDFLDTLPARVAYRGILQLLDSPVEMGGSSYQITHIDGCDSACESCFQLAHCPVAREILGNEWRLAVDQAGINPSWSALFAADEED
jgi:hypothetical protein